MVYSQPYTTHLLLKVLRMIVILMMKKLKRQVLMGMKMRHYLSQKRRKEVSTWT
jgi:hypothetical protein